MIDQGLIDASRSSQNPVLLGSTMIGGERERVMAAPSHAVKDESVLPTQHKRWWSMIPTIMGSEEKSNASKNTAHDADVTAAAAVVTDTTTKLKHRRSVSYNTTYHVPSKERDTYAEVVSIFMQLHHSDPAYIAPIYLSSYLPSSLGKQFSKTTLFITPYGAFRPVQSSN